jgi:hypothetical protein
VDESAQPRARLISFALSVNPVYGRISPTPLGSHLIITRLKPGGPGVIGPSQPFQRFSSCLRPIGRILFAPLKSVPGYNVILEPIQETLVASGGTPSKNPIRPILANDAEFRQEARILWGPEATR